ncbi:MAG TPA: polysaccharide biosynthesis C-terminal domain-containing protein [Chitinophagaceae bacterium]|nr:polysaccharide biosynthesis C-terminal domain-containing protein [Chitinophagaceae bacterium]
MSSIRRQSIISSFVIYSGFAVGLLNTYFFTKEGKFEDTHYGLINVFLAITTMMAATSTMAMPSFISKFYHYYADHLSPRRNDMMTVALMVSLAGFLLVMIAGWFFKDLVIRKFGGNSPMLVTYYYWIFPMGLGFSIYTVLEAYTWNLGKPVLTNFLREVQWRLLTTLLIILFIAGVIGDFDLFIKFYAFTYPGIAITLLLYLVFTRQIHFTFSISKVTRRYFRSIVRLCGFLYSGVIVYTISQVFDIIVIASVLEDGTAKAGIFGLAQIMATVIQAPQRGIVASSIPHLARAWKDKNMGLLQRIYQRSSINQLIFAIGLFLLIALNYREAILSFDLKASYLTGFNAFILLGLMKVVDMGTGVNAQIIGTSSRWKIEFISGVILLALMLPLTYILAVKLGIIGPAIANLVSVVIYNLIRIVFLWKRFRLFPFTIQSLYTILLAAVVFIICYWGFVNLHGFWGLVLRSLAFLVLYGAGVIYFKLSPDIQPVLLSLINRFSRKSG